MRNFSAMASVGRQHEERKCEPNVNRMGNEWETNGKCSMAISSRKHTLKCEYASLPYKRFAFRTKVSHKGRNRAINKGVSTTQHQHDVFGAYPRWFSASPAKPLILLASTGSVPAFSDPYGQPLINQKEAARPVKGVCLKKAGRAA